MSIQYLSSAARALSRAESAKDDGQSRWKNCRWILPPQSLTTTIARLKSDPSRPRPTQIWLKILNTGDSSILLPILPVVAPQRLWSYCQHFASTVECPVTSYARDKAMKPLAQPANAILVGTTFVFLGLTPARAQPFEFGGPDINPSHYRLTTFAEDLNFPVGMAELPDGSIMVAVSNGSSFFSSGSGQLLRLIDDDGDGQSDRQVVMASGVPGGGLTALKVAGNLILTTGQGRGKPISIYRFGDTFDEPLTRVGELTVNYPDGSWRHPHSALAIRQVGDQPATYELFFQLGSDTNFNVTQRMANLSSDIGVSGALAGDAVHSVTISDDGNRVTGSNLRQIATGLRNSAGFAFDSDGNLYLQDNGIDGITNANEPTSADELNFISNNEIGNTIIDFGFPDSYTEYRTGNVIGGTGRQPLVSFLPLPEPATGKEAEGPNDITLAPPSFPLPLRAGVFVGMHGRYSLGGVSNEENSVVFVDLRDHSYFHFVENDEENVGHIDGLMSTEDSLFLADMSPGGRLDQAQTGIIYQLKSLIPSIDELSLAIRRGDFDEQFDLDGNGKLDADDRAFWVVDINRTYFGDANLDGVFDSSDLTKVFQAGEYEDKADGNSQWSTGDWNGDAEFESGDIVLAFQDGGYDRGPRMDVNAVPEPSSLAMLFAGLIAVTIRRRRVGLRPLRSRSRLPNGT